MNNPLRKKATPRIAKLFAGPQDGLVLEVGVLAQIINWYSPVDPEGDPQNMIIDIYGYVPDWCIDPECGILHYQYITTEQTGDI